jgi:polyribonucleotide nucleotidyltransferase
MHHYNFPPYAVGETGKVGNPNRRAIGHGALAKKALEPIIPSKEEFPYTIRLVSETMSSNGSSSMGSVCASSLSLMDAAVPVKAAVSGIAMGLMLENPESETRNQKYKILTDIQGPEDHHGDTDFKAAGSEKGITAIQMDVKIKGLTVNILEDLLKQSKKARLAILKEMNKTIAKPREHVSPYAPHIITLQINPEKKGDLIGPGGKTINKIIETTGVDIDIEENGKVFITGDNEVSTNRAKELIEEITYEPQVGELFKGKITRILEFGAFVEVKPGIEGLIHISELAPFRVNKVTDIVKEGDIVPVKLKEIDELGRLNFSLKQADPDYAKRQEKRK